MYMTLGREIFINLNKKMKTIKTMTYFISY